MTRQKLIIHLRGLHRRPRIWNCHPILPYYVTEFGVSPTVVTLLFATFSLFAF